MDGEWNFEFITNYLLDMVELLRSKKQAELIQPRNRRCTPHIMVRMKRSFIFTGLILLSLFMSLPIASAVGNYENNEEFVCTVYISGIGCPNCAATDPVLLTEFTSKYPNLIVIEYEIYQLKASNLDIANKYFDTYIPEARAGVPFLIFNKDQTALGKFQVLDSEEIIKNLDSNECPLPDGSSVDFENLDLTNLPGKVKIWTKNRVLISGGGDDNQVLKKLITEETISSMGSDFEKIDPESVPISGDEVEFDYAIKMGEQILHWNGEPIKRSGGVKEASKSAWKNWYWLLIVIAISGALFLLYKIWLVKKGA